MASICSTGFWKSSTKLYDFRYRKFSCSAIMTPEEQEQRILYANILEYEQDHVSVWWLSVKFFEYV